MAPPRSAVSPPTDWKSSKTTFAIKIEWIDPYGNFICALPDRKFGFKILLPKLKTFNLSLVSNFYWKWAWHIFIQSFLTFGLPFKTPVIPLTTKLNNFSKEVFLIQCLVYKVTIRLFSDQITALLSFLMINSQIA